MRFKEIRPGMAIHCQREEDANTLLEHLDTLGYRWFSNMRLTEENLYHGCGEETCYFINYNKKVTFGICDGYREEGYTITEFSDLIEIESRFKVGDKAIVRDDLIIGKGYGGDCEFSKDMERFKGKIVTIKEECFPGEYEIKEDGQQWMWTNSMLKTMENVDENKSTEMSAVEVLEWFRENYENHDVMRKVFGHDLAFRRIIVNNSPQKIIENITAYESAKKEQKPVDVEYGWYCEILKMGKGGVMETVDRHKMWEGDEQTAMDEAAERARQYAVDSGTQTCFRVCGICRVKAGGVID